MPSDQAPALRLANHELAHTGYPSAGVQPKNSLPSLLVVARVLAAILSVSVATIRRMDASGKVAGPGPTWVRAWPSEGSRPNDTRRNSRLSEEPATAGNPSKRR